MKKWMFAGISAVALLVSSPAMADVDIGVSIGLPGIFYPGPVYVEPRPVYVAPPPVYYEPPVVYRAPRHVYPRSVYYYGDRHSRHWKGHRHGHRGHGHGHGHGRGHHHRHHK